MPCFNIRASTKNQTNDLFWIKQNALTTAGVVSLSSPMWQTQRFVECPVVAEDPGHEVEYLYFPVSLSWNDARRTCIEHGGDLAALNSPQDTQMVVDVYNRNYAFTHNLWVRLL